jgi:tRNA A37 methylthiotransferase MiaB
VKRERMDRILELARLSQRKFQDDCLNTEAEVLWEDQKSDYWIGTSDNYLRVRSRASGQPSGQISTVLLTRSDSQGMQGQPLPTTPSARPGAIGHTGTAHEARTNKMEAPKSLAQS